MRNNRIAKNNPIIIGAIITWKYEQLKLAELTFRGVELALIDIIYMI